MRMKSRAFWNHPEGASFNTCGGAGPHEAPRQIASTSIQARPRTSCPHSTRFGAEAPLMTAAISQNLENLGRRPSPNDRASARAGKALSAWLRPRVAPVAVMMAAAALRLARPMVGPRPRPRPPRAIGGGHQRAVLEQTRRVLGVGDRQWRDQDCDQHQDDQVTGRHAVPLGFSAQP